MVALMVAGCSLNPVPLEPVDMGPAANCDGLGIPAIACATGRTVPVCTLDAAGRSRWTITCPDQQDAAMGGAAGAGGGSGGTGGGASDAGGGGGAPCISTTSCGKDEVCTTEDGVCKAPPGCGPGVGCPAVCYGNCRPASAGGACMRDDDCQLASDYCTGCDCRALAKGETLPKCPGPGVQCLVDPCERLTAVCVNGKCSAQ